jgi:hypothetical protein
MANLILSLQFLGNALTHELTTYSGNATVRLGTSSIPFSDTTALGAITAGEPAYPGYAPQIWALTPVGQVGNEFAVPQGVVVFNPPSSGPSSVITQFAALYTTPGNNTAVMGGGNLTPSDTLSVGGPGLTLVLNMKDLDFNAP